MHRAIYNSSFGLQLVPKNIASFMFEPLTALLSCSIGSQLLVFHLQRLPALCLALTLLKMVECFAMTEIFLNPSACFPAIQDTSWWITAISQSRIHPWVVWWMDRGVWRRLQDASELTALPPLRQSNRFVAITFGWGGCLHRRPYIFITYFSFASFNSS